MTKRATRSIVGDLFGAPAVTKVDRKDPTLVTELPEIKPVKAVEAQAVRDAVSTQDAQVLITSYLHKGVRRYSSAPCPACGYASDEYTRENARTAYVMHRARERQPPLIEGDDFGGKLHPYNDDGSTP